MCFINKCWVIFLVIILLAFLNPAYCQEDQPFDLDPIVITKSNLHLLRSYSIEGLDLEDLPFRSAIEGLSLLPLDLQSRSLRGAIQTDFSLRGSSFQGVLVLVDGQRINDPQTGHHHSDIPLIEDDIERIEVIPGAASSIFGPDAIGGAINIITKKPNQKEGVIKLSLGSDQTKSMSLSITERLDKLGVKFSLENQESDGFYYDTDFKKFTSSLRSTLDIPDGEFDLTFGYQEKEFGAYDFYTPESGYPSKEWTKTYLLNAGVALEKGDLLIKPNFLMRRHFDKFLLDKTLKRSRYLNHHRTDIYSPSIYLRKKTINFGDIGLGLEYGEERMNSTNLGIHSREHRSVSIDNRKNFNDQFSLGLSYRLDDFDAFGRVHTGSFSFRHNLCAKNEIFFAVSKSMRIPSFTELYYNDPTTVGDPDLSAEKSLNYEFGYDYQGQDLSLGLSFFLRDEENFIDWVKREPGQAKWQVENITEAEVFGIENDLKLAIGEVFSLSSNYTYIDKRIDDRGYLYKYGANYIRHLINTGFNFELPFGKQAIVFTYKKKPRRDGWLLLGMHFSYKRIFLNITNLLNVEYQEIEGIPQPGRYLEAGVRFDW